MKFALPSPLKRVNRWLVLTAVGFAGLLFTFGVSKALFDSAQERLEQRFNLAAMSRAQPLRVRMRNQLDQVATLQRMFDSVEQVDWPAFQRFVKPMVSKPGVRSFSWMPLDETASIANSASTASDVFDEENTQPHASTVSARTFPVLYSVPEQIGRETLGLNSQSDFDKLIDRAVNEGAPVSIEVGQLPVDGSRSANLAILAPVYLGGEVPPTEDARQIAIRGIVMAVFSIDGLFEDARSKDLDSELIVRMFGLQADFAESAEHGERVDWLISPPRYSENFEVARHLWITIQIEPTAAWLAANASNSALAFALVGVLATLVLLIFLYRLLGRSALVDSLESELESDQAKRLATEVWADKLTLAVEQNPAAIFITDTNGLIQYVNDKFLENTGYSRDEVVGQSPQVLQSGSTSEDTYVALWRAVSAGNTWQGELQNKRKDGVLYWSRLLIAPMRDHDGQLSSFIGIEEDVTELRDAQNKLQESESRFRGAMTVMVEGLAILSPKGEFLFGNRSAEEFLGCADTGLAGYMPHQVGIERLREDGSPCPMEEFPTIITLREGREVRDVVLGFRSADNQIRWMQINTSPMAMGKGEQHGVVMTFSEITERWHAEEQLKLAFEAINHSSEGIMVTDAEHRMVSVNPALEKMLGYNLDEVIGQLPELFAVDANDGGIARVREILELEDQWQGEVLCKRKDGVFTPCWMGVSVVRTPNGRAKNFVSIFSDITERKETLQRIEFLAHHDPLTGLPNRLLLRDRAEQAMAQASRMQNQMALMFLDLDRFKTINDSLGHPVGDELLKVVVERLRDCVRESDTISRQGGDEFIILLNDVRDSESVSRVADKIHQRMSDPVILGNHMLNTSFSIGIALYPDDGDDFDSLMQKADTAMYHAKEAGRNAHRFFTEQMNQKVVEHMTLENQLRHALENKEFVLHYQPQMDLHECKIIGVEALIRWNSPEHGLVPPAKFIPIAEDSGLIVAIGAWVINEACRQARAWQDAGLPPFVVAVNLSAVQFKRLDLVTTVINALVLSDLDSQWLELELTESILIQDAEATLDSVRRLKALGVKLSVDDFGTGYSSLTYLKRFAVDKLKIDQSFVRDLVSDPDDAAIVRAIIQMAHSLKLKTIAEGVETEELANLLRLFHCDEIQGFWFARPMPAKELEDFVRERL